MDTPKMKRVQPQVDFDPNNPPHFIGGFEITKIVREHVPLHGGGDMTFGQLLDMQMKVTAIEGGEMQSVTIEINPEAWRIFADSVRTDKH